MRYLFIFLLILAFNAYGAKSFPFDHNSSEWGLWGEGLGAHVTNEGHKKKGSIWLSTDFGESHTTHYRWNDLRPGLYKVSVYVRAKNVQPSEDKSSFWHFHDGGYGETTIFNDLSGSYDWRKVEYTIKVKGSDLSVWFRLKSPGQVWIDDFKLEKAHFASEVVIDSPRTLQEASARVQTTKSHNREKVIVDFDKYKAHTPFAVISNRTGNHMGKFSTRDYYNFEVRNILNGNWDGFDRIEMDVFNSEKKFLNFYLTLTDDLTTNYWSQLNHKTSLAPGWNHLSFSLKQFVGERGSHRFMRSINLKKLDKFFIVSDPESSSPKVMNKLFIDNIKLKSIPYPEVPEGVTAIDFTSHKSYGQTGMQKVSSQMLYNDRERAGFVNPRFWRVEDSQYASETLRYSIGILDGTFRMKVPNGVYKISLIMDKLGYWDPPFWRKRSVAINGNMMILETRNNSGDYLRDYLRFENMMPSEDVHPFDLYLKSVMKPYEAQVTVRNNFLDFEFSGDPSGISLNRLFVWQIENDRQAKSYIAEIEKRDRLEFDWISRPINKISNKTKESFLIRVIKPDLLLSPADIRKEHSAELIFNGGRGEKPYQMLQLYSESADNVSWTISDLKTADGKKISSSSLKISDLMYQYVSPDLNHETYMVTGKFLKPVVKSAIQLSPKTSRYLFIQLPVSNSLAAGEYSGEITFKGGTQRRKIPIKTVIHPYSLPKVDFPVGFFGLDPIPHTWFESPDMQATRKNYRMQALKLLGEAGFTTFTGLPEVTLKSSEEQLILNTSELDELFSKAKEYGMDKYVFTYGGRFPHSLIDESQKPYNMDSETYHQILSRTLKAYFENPAWPSIVHTFSDEAGGYSDRVQQDLNTADWLRKKYSFLSLGGFSSMTNSYAQKLNNLFDFGFYSHLDKNVARKFESKGKKWGSYNGAPGNLHDPRFAFGPGLFAGRNQGMSHYLEWHATALNNYPYYDLDGRESDVSMFIPASNGQLYTALRFELAVQGLHSYRKLTLLKNLIFSKKTDPHINEAKAWLQKITHDEQYFNKQEYLKGEGFDFDKFESELNIHLSSVLK